MTDSVGLYLLFFLLLAAIGVLLFMSITKDTKTNALTKPLNTDFGKEGEFATELSPQVTKLRPLFSYQDSRIVAMAKDPHSVHVYWDLDENLKASLVSHQPALRLFKVESATTLVNMGYYLINNNTNNWYLSVPSANTTYLVELGYFNEIGHFISLLKSNAIFTPQNSLSSDVDSNWPPIDGVYTNLDLKEHISSFKK